MNIENNFLKNIRPLRFFCGGNKAIDGNAGIANSYRDMEILKVPSN